MKIQAMLDWSPDEKAAKVKEWTQSLFTLRLQKATGQLENPMKIKQLRKDIARLRTAQHMGAAKWRRRRRTKWRRRTPREPKEKISANEKSAAAAAKPKGARRGDSRRQGREEARGGCEGHRARRRPRAREGPFTL